VRRRGYLELHYSDDVWRVLIGVRVDHENAVHSGLIADLKREGKRPIPTDTGCAAPAGQGSAVQCRDRYRFARKTHWKLKLDIGICTRIHCHGLEASGTAAVGLNDLLRIAVRDLIRVRHRCLPRGYPTAAKTEERGR